MQDIIQETNKAKLAGQSQKIFEELPVFVKPKNLKFCEKIKSSHKQILTIYNPYQFVIKYKIRCTNPRNYIVSEPIGLIEQNCCSEILVKRKQFVEDCVGETDAFKVLIYHQDNSSSSSVRRKHQLEWNLLGSLEFIAIVTSDLNNFPISNTQDTEQSLSEPFTEEIDQALSDKAKKEEEKKTTGTETNYQVYYYIAILLCLLLIGLPTTELNEPNWFFLPEYFTLTVSQKNVLYLILGYLSAELVRTLQVL